jgi:hypothetical protein
MSRDLVVLVFEVFLLLIGAILEIVCDFVLKKIVFHIEFREYFIDFHGIRKGLLLTLTVSQIKAQLFHDSIAYKLGFVDDFRVNLAFFTSSNVATVAVNEDPAISVTRTFARRKRNDASYDKVNESYYSHKGGEVKSSSLYSVKLFELLGVFIEDVGIVI